jgi:predicted NUDIX family NTP pyrophosphohydrolase
MKKSAGILLYRKKAGATEVLLVHPGGPFWKNKDAGAWSIPKGEFTDEDPLSAAKREFEEETGIAVDGNFLALSPLKQKSGKLVMAWALQKNIDASKIKSNEFDMEWPPRSGRQIRIPEVDRGEWFTPSVAKQKIIPGQAALIDELLGKLQDG